MIGQLLWRTLEKKRNQSSNTLHRVKPLAELRPSDIPSGIDPYDLATDFAPEGSSVHSVFHNE